MLSSEKRSYFLKIFFEKSFGYLLVIICLFLFFVNNVFAYDFQKLRKTLEEDLETSEIRKGRLAVVYDIEQHNTVKKRVNLIEIKKELSRELLKTFQVADPVIVREILNKNKIVPKELVKNKKLRKIFCDRQEN